LHSILVKIKKKKCLNCSYKTASLCGLEASLSAAPAAPSSASFTEPTSSFPASPLSLLDSFLAAPSVASFLAGPSAWELTVCSRTIEICYLWAFFCDLTFVCSRPEICVFCELNDISPRTRGFFYFWAFSWSWPVSAPRTRGLLLLSVFWELTGVSPQNKRFVTWERFLGADCMLSVREQEILLDNVFCNLSGYWLIFLTKRL
jgi:hypothetical protein